MRISDWSSDVCSSDLRCGETSRYAGCPRCALFVGAASGSAFDYGPDQLPGARGMPASFFRFAPGWRTLGLAVALTVALAAFCPATFAVDVLVVPDRRHTALGRASGRDSGCKYV